MASDAGRRVRWESVRLWCFRVGSRSVLVLAVFVFRPVGTVGIVSRQFHALVELSRAGVVMLLAASDQSESGKEKSGGKDLLHSISDFSARPRLVQTGSQTQGRLKAGQHAPRDSPLPAPRRTALAPGVLPTGRRHFAGARSGRRGLDFPRRFAYCDSRVTILLFLSLCPPGKPALPASPPPALRQSATLRAGPPVAIPLLSLPNPRSGSMSSRPPALKSAPCRR